jgi:hypothetical protein
MKFIRITSEGEIDTRAFSLVGATSKRNDNTKIGMFGSGLKYTLSYLLNKGIDFKVFSGYREVCFTTLEEDFRGVKIKRIFVNGESTSLTTDMGMDWKRWFVIREIYCNAIDEGGASIKLVDFESINSVVPVEDCTTFYIAVDEEFQEILDNWDLYFSEKRKDLLYHDDNFNQLYVGNSNMIVYRKGIQCKYVSDYKSLFHYDLSWVKINESRVIGDDFTFRYNLCGFLKEINDEKIIYRILYNINDCFEKNLYWDNSSGIFSDAWLNVIGDKYLIPFENSGFWQEEINILKSDCIIVPTSMVNGLKLQFGDKLKVIGDSTSGNKGDMKLVDSLDKRQQYILNEAIAFLNSSNYQIKYPIKVVKFTSPDVLGLAKDETIYISEVLFTRGIRDIVCTIFEENEHNITGYNDETRTFQNHLINMVISSFEERTGKYI